MSAPAISTHTPYSNTHPGRKWFECAECHQENSDHPLLQSFDMTFACKKCKKCFRKDSREFEERYGGGEWHTHGRHADGGVATSTARIATTTLCLMP